MKKSNDDLKQLNEDLKSGDFKSIYLFYGEESYLKRQYKNRFVKSMIPDGDTLNYNYYEGGSIDVGQVIEAAETLPFFSDCRLILLEDSGFFKSAENALVSVLQKLPETTRIIFVEKEIDRRKKLYKVVEANGCIAQLSRQSDSVLIQWITNIAKESGKQIEPSTIKYLLEKVGNDMENIHNELMKLVAYVDERTIITKTDIDDICSVQIESQVFDLTRAVASGNSKKALALYYDLLDLKEKPFGILALMLLEYRRIFQVKDLVEQGCSQKEISQKTGINPYFVEAYRNRANGFTSEGLKNILEEIAQLDQDIKRGLIKDQLAVELFIVGHSNN